MIHHNPPPASREKYSFVVLGLDLLCCLVPPQDVFGTNQAYRTDPVTVPFFFHFDEISKMNQVGPLNMHFLTLFVKLVKIKVFGP